MVGLLLFSAFTGSHPVYAAPSATVTVSNLNDSGAGSLRQAISDASDGDTIDFITNGIITLTSELVIDKSLTINGGGVITVSGNSAVRVFNVTIGNATFDSLTIANGYSSDRGGGIQTASGVAITVTNSTLTNNSATNSGGGIYNNAGSVTVISSTLSGNVAVTYFGGGIINDAGTVSVTNSTFSGNSAANVGGGISNISGTAMVDNSIFSENSAPTGGGIYNSDTVIVASSTFSGNLASGSGGGIYHTTGTMTVSDSTFSSNLATYGGGIYNIAGTGTVNNSTFSSNSVTHSGGGIYNASIITVTNSTLFSNAANDNHGGGIVNYGTATVSNSTLSGNSADTGGGISNQSGSLTVANNALSGNSAVSLGGGISNEFGTLTVTNSTLSSNSASNGGGILNINGPMTVSHSTFSGNSADDSGGGIRNDFDTISVSNSTFSNNSASYGGGISNFNNGTITVSNSTLSGNSASNGGGIYNPSTMTVANSIIANSLSGDDCVGTITSMGYNLDSDGSCTLAAVGDMSTVSPLLGPLADNGGPATGSGQATMTHALLPNSPAIEAGNCSSGPATDQRGVARPQDPFCDIGSFESPSLLTVSSVGPGSVSWNPVQAEYEAGTVVTITAVSDKTGWSLIWNGDLSGSTTPEIVMMNRTKTITATFSNDPPTASAGTNQTVLAAQLVTLDGTGSSDADPTQTLIYHWAQTGGLAVVLNDDTAVFPTFIAPASPTNLTFTLTVTDSLGLPGLPSEVAVTVQPYTLFLPLVVK